MRRRRAPAPAVPEQLARFVAAEWPGGCPHEQLRAWQGACFAWLAEDSVRQPWPDADWDFNRTWLAGASRRRLPFGEHGDPLDVLREGRGKRRGIPPCPHEYRPAQYWVNGRESQV